MAAIFCGRQRGRVAQLHQHAGFGRLACFGVQRILGQRDVDARLFHFADGHDGAFQLAFNGAMIIHLFGEFAGAEVGLIEQLEADAAGFGQSRGGHLQAGFGDLVGRNQNRGAAVARRYSTPASCSLVTSAPASSAARPVNRGLKSRSSFQWLTQVRPPITAATATTIQIRWVQERRS